MTRTIWLRITRQRLRRDMGLTVLFDTLQKLHEKGYSAMTLATASLIAVAWMHWIEGPAMTARVVGVETGVQQIQVRQLEEKLEKTETALCMDRGNSGLLERRRELRDQYWNLTKTNYDTPSCDLLLRLK